MLFTEKCRDIFPNMFARKILFSVLVSDRNLANVCFQLIFSQMTPNKFLTKYDVELIKYGRQVNDEDKLLDEIQFTYNTNEIKALHHQILEYKYITK